MRSRSRTHHQVTFAVLAQPALPHSADGTSLVVPVLTHDQAELHTSQGTATGVLTLYILSESISRRSWGDIGDMRGQKGRVFDRRAHLARDVGSLLASEFAPNIWIISLPGSSGIRRRRATLAFGHRSRTSSPRERSPAQSAHRSCPRSATVSIVLAVRS